MNDLLKDLHPTNSFEEGIKQTRKPTRTRAIAAPPGAITVEAYCAKTGLSLRAARYHIARGEIQTILAPYGGNKARWLRRMIVVGRNKGQLTAAQQLTRQQQSQKEVTDALVNLVKALHALKRSGVEVSKEVRTFGEWRLIVERVKNNEPGTH